MEYIGDRVLYVAITMNTLHMSSHKLSSDGFYIGLSCAELHKKSISQTNNNQLCAIMNSKYLKFLKELVIAPRTPNSDESKMWADIYESIFGAIALDCDFDMNTILKSYLASKTIAQHKGLFNYIESKKESDQKTKFINLISILILWKNSNFCTSFQRV